MHVFTISQCGYQVSQQCLGFQKQWMLLQAASSTEHYFAVLLHCSVHVACQMIKMHLWHIIIYKYNFNQFQLKLNESVRTKDYTVRVDNIIPNHCLHCKKTACVQKRIHPRKCKRMYKLCHYISVDVKGWYGRSHLHTIDLLHTHRLRKTRKI